MVPVNAALWGQMWKDSSSDDMNVSSVKLDLFPSSDLSGWFTSEGIWSRGKSENPPSNWPWVANLPWVAILTSSVRQSCHEKFLAVIGEHPRKIPFLALVLNLADLLVGGLTHTLHPKVLSWVQFSFFPVVGWIRLAD